MVVDIVRCEFWVRDWRNVLYVGRLMGFSMAWLIGVVLQFGSWSGKYWCM